MDRNDFIRNIINRHKIETNASLLIQDYETVMSENVDFDDLFTTYLNEYTLSKPPAPAWFAQRLKYKNNENNEPESINFGTIYTIINGRKYTYGYNPKFETEEKAINNLKKFHPDIEILTYKQYYGLEN